MEIPPPEELRSALIVPHKILMGPGPSNASPRILQALSKPVLGHMHSELFKIMDDIKKGIQYVFQTKSKLTLAVSASGHAGMETVFSNLLEPGDRVLIIVNGLWGERATDTAERYGAVVKKLQKSVANDNFSIIEIENAVKIFLPKLLFIVQGESSTGIYQPLEGIGDVTRRYNCLLAVDTVASLGAVPFYMDLWKVDAVYSGCQKIIGTPPGLAPISFNQRAQHVIFRRKSRAPYYFDMTLLGQQWNCFEQDMPRLIPQEKSEEPTIHLGEAVMGYHHTTSANLLYALREGLATIVEEGLENVIRRHQDCAALIYKGLERLGFDFFVEEEHKRLPSVTTILVPKRIDWRHIVEYAMKNYQLELGGPLTPTAGNMLRIGIMGYNATPEKVKFTLDVLKEGLAHCRNSSKL